MATKDEIRELLHSELGPIKYQLENIEKKSVEITKSIDFLSSKYDQLLDKQQSFDKKLLAINQTVKNLKEEVKETNDKERESKASVKELAQYLRRDYVEISGIGPSEEHTCIEITKSIGEAMGMTISDADISTAHPIPSYNKDAAPKNIVKFTRRDTHNMLYNNRR